MTKIDIISGFLGAGKTTLIKKLLSDAYKGEQVVLIENEFGEIGIDGGFLKEAGIEIREMNSGCICCSLVGDFGKSLHEVVDTYHPDRILIEPSGVGKLSDVIKAVQDVQGEIDAELNSFTTVVDVTKCKIYRKNFGEFFSNQIEYAGAVILSRTDKAKPEKIQESVALLRELNEKAPIITTPIEQLPGEKILETMESSKSLEEELLAEVAEEAHEHEHEHEHDDHCCHHHHHHHDHEGGEVEEYGIGTFVYCRRRPFDMNYFDDFVARKWPKGVIRCKGLCWFKDDPDNCFLFEQAGNQKGLKSAGMWYATMPADELRDFKKQNPALEADWDERYGDRVQKLVFIGQHLDRKAIADALDFCLTDADV